MKTSLPHVTGFGLLLWQLEQSPDRRVSCQFGECESELVLVIRDEDGGIPVAEPYSDIEPLLERAQAIREFYVRAGWSDCRALERAA